MSAQKQEKSAKRREACGSLRKLPSGRWQARDPGPDGVMHTTRPRSSFPDVGHSRCRRGCGFPQYV